MARITLATPCELSEEERDLLESLSPKEELPEEYHHLIEDPVRNIYRAVGHTPSLLRAFRTFGRTVWAECGLDGRGREVVILTTARTLNATYEWHQHVRIGLKEGLTPAEIRSIGADDRTAFEDDERVLVEFAAAFATGKVDTPILQAFAEQYDETTAVSVGMLVGLYSVVALLGSGFDLETEEPFVGWGLNRLHG